MGKKENPEDYDHRFDIFSMGIVFFALCTKGLYPYIKDNNSKKEDLKKNVENNERQNNISNKLFKKHLINIIYKMIS